MLAALTDTAVDLVLRYGYVALFLFIVLETAWIIHFVPSEVVIPLSAAVLVSSPAGFALFVGVMTVGAVLGSLLCYYLFGVNGELVLRRYGDRLYIPEEEIERSQAWFRRWGEGLILWGRVVPVLRTPISMPAGFARMGLGKFTLYSSVGWLAYNSALVWLVYSGGEGTAPIEVVLGPLVGAASANPALSVAVALAVGVAGAAAWLERERLGRALGR